MAAAAHDSQVDVEVVVALVVAAEVAAARAVTVHPAWAEQAEISPPTLIAAVALEAALAYMVLQVWSSSS